MMQSPDWRLLVSAVVCDGAIFADFLELSFFLSTTEIRMVGASVVIQRPSEKRDSCNFFMTREEKRSAT